MLLRFRQSGVTSIEFALGSIVLMFLTFAIFELCYRIYVINMTDYALRETIRKTKVAVSNSQTIENINTDYENTFDSIINDDSNLWHILIDSDKFSFSGKYYKEYKDFVSDVGQSDFKGLSYNYSLAEMTVTYQYSPLISLFGWTGSTITRTMVLNLEHQGWGEYE